MSGEDGIAGLDLEGNAGLSSEESRALGAEAGFSSEESRVLGAEARQARLEDRALSDKLGGPEPRSRVASSRYLHELGRRPRLPAELERKLIADAKGGDRSARAQLVEAFLPAIASVARVYRGRGRIERAELMQEGVVGLLRALERYDPGRGVPFWGYAVWWVRQAMQQLVAELSRPVVLSDHALRQLAQLREVHAGHLRRHGREPTAQELAAASGVDREDVDNLLATERPARSLEAPAGGGVDEGVGRFGELVRDPLAEDEYERVVAQVAAEGLRGLLSGLSERERRILSAHYGLDGPEQSLREIAAPLGLSAERVRQLERRAVGKLRAGAGVDSDGWTPIPTSRRGQRTQSRTGGDSSKAGAERSTRTGLERHGQSGRRLPS
jgi:RNA polymerase sigma factor (sigma-70 family)